MGRRPIIQIAPSTFVVLALSVFLLPLRWIVCWLIAVTAHEAGHLIVSRLCGASIQRISLTSAGAIMETDGLTPGKQLLSSAAGPVAGLFLLFFSRWIPLTSTLALIHSVFNLLPLRNLDGAVILNSTLCLFRVSKNVDRICRVADILARILLAGIGLTVAWKLSWTLAGILTILLLLRIKRNPCKRGILQVQ